MLTHGPSKSQVLKNWPPAVIYLTTPIYSKTLTSEHLSSLQSHSTNSSIAMVSTTKGACQLVKITPISSPSHPASGQYGLFTSANLKPGTFILQYIGEIHASSPPDDSSPKPDLHAESNYDLSLDREQGIGIDANSAGNEARFINDYRGVAEAPNAEFKEIWDDRRKERGMGVFVLPEGKSGKGKGIKKGNEILVSYGRGFWGARKGAGQGAESSG